MICLAAITPHPPIIVPGIGRGAQLKAVAQTIAAMEQLGQELAQVKPDTIVLVSPHASLDYSAFAINEAPQLKGDLSAFGLGLAFSFKNNLRLVKELKSQASIGGLATVHYESELDHGALVPLYYLTRQLKFQLVHLSFSFQDFKTHLRYGATIGQVCAATKERVALIASGDLSHRLKPDAPAGFSPHGKMFDNKLIELLQQGNVESIIKLDPSFMAEAGECGFRSILMLLGALSGRPYHFNLKSYEGPFGVGYLTARLI